MKTSVAPPCGAVRRHGGARPSASASRDQRSGRGGTCGKTCSTGVHGATDVAQRRSGIVFGDRCLAERPASVTCMNSALLLAADAFSIASEIRRADQERRPSADR